MGFYTKNLNDIQLNYTIGKKALLGIVEGLKAFKGVIWGQNVTVYTDHLNQLYNKLYFQRMIEWIVLLEECYPKIVHVTGVDNNAADALLRLDITTDVNDTREWGEKNKC